MNGRLEEVLKADVPRGTFEKLHYFVSFLIEANRQQNLIGRSTLVSIWERHILDSAQLIPLAHPGAWLDIGSGAGFPGIVIAIFTSDPITLLEPRRRRAEFLTYVRDELALTNVTVRQSKPPALHESFTNITARAVASASSIFSMAHHLSRQDTIWLLPKGRGAQKELDEVWKAWQGDFTLEPSQTDAEASILVATGVRPRGKR